MSKLYQKVNGSAVPLSGGVGVINNLNSTSTKDALSANMGKALNDTLTADNNQLFKFGYDSATQKYGYYVKEAGTDVFVPFSSGGNQQVASGTFELSRSDTTKVTLGFKPKYLCVYVSTTSFETAPTLICTYNADLSKDSAMRGTSSGLNTFTLPSTSGNQIDSIDDDGFTFGMSVSAVGTYGRCFAIGEDAKEPLDLSKLTKASKITATKGTTKDYVVSELTKVEFVIITNTANDSYVYTWYNGKQTIGEGASRLSNHINSVVGNTINLTCTSSSGDWDIWAFGTV